MELKRLPAVVYKPDKVKCDDCKREMKPGERLYPVIDMAYSEGTHFDYFEKPHDWSGMRMWEAHVCFECLGKKKEPVEEKQRKKRDRC